MWLRNILGSAMASGDGHRFPDAIILLYRFAPGVVLLQLLEGLNPAQREAVTIPSGPLLILAGPGSGKTRVITHRVAYLIHELGVSPYNIMAVTFTNKAANEMKARLEKLAGREGEGLTVGTFHATCSRILRREAQYLGLEPHFVIYDDDDQVSLIKRVMKDLELDEKRFSPRGILSEISAAKSVLKGPHQYGEFSETYRQEIVSRVYRRYQDLLSQNGALDFDDLLMLTVELFSSEPGCPGAVPGALSLPPGGRVPGHQHRPVRPGEAAGRASTATSAWSGDPDQSIYSWRAADIRNILNFETDFPDLKVVLLEQNYRSTGTILQVAQGVINSNKMRKEKRLWTENSSGSPITVYEAYNEEEEASYVAREIDRLAGRGGRRLRDFAVMYRTNAQSRALEDKFIRYGLRYRLVGGVRFYERREVKDVLAYLRLLQNPSDSIALQRVINLPPRGIGERTMAELGRVSQQRQISLFEAIRASVSGDGEGGAAGRASLAPRIRNSLAAFLKIVDTLVEDRGQVGILPAPGLGRGAYRVPGLAPGRVGRG